MATAHTLVFGAAGSCKPGIAKIEDLLAERGVTVSRRAISL